MPVIFEWKYRSPHGFLSEAWHRGYQLVVVGWGEYDWRWQIFKPLGGLLSSGAEDAETKARYQAEQTCLKYIDGRLPINAKEPWALVYEVCATSEYHGISCWRLDRTSGVLCMVNGPWGPRKTGPLGERQTGYIWVVCDAPGFGYSGYEDDAEAAKAVALAQCKFLVLQHRRRPSPALYEELMGYPSGWTLPE
jgi:hypothetical protein